MKPPGSSAFYNLNTMFHFQVIKTNSKIPGIVFQCNHFTLITTLKAFSPNIVTFSDGGRGKDFNTGINWEGEEGHKSAHNHE